MKLLINMTAGEVEMNLQMHCFNSTQLVETTSNKLTHMGRHGHTAVKVDTKVADGVSWVDFCIAKGEGTAVK